MLAQIRRTYLISPALKGGALRRRRVNVLAFSICFSLLCPHPMQNIACDSFSCPHALHTHGVTDSYKFAPQTGQYCASSLSIVRLQSGHVNFAMDITPLNGKYDIDKIETADKILLIPA